MKRIAKILLLCGLLLPACDRSKLRIDRAYAKLEKGYFDAALYDFHELYKESPRDPRVLSSLGLLLSLKRVSLLSAIDLLKTSLKIKADAEVRRQLAMIYALMGETKRIIELTRSEQLDVEEAFTPSLLQLHGMASCLEKPSLRKLERLKTAPRQKDSPFYLFLCELALRKKEKDSIALLKSYYLIKDPRMRCEALSLCFVIENILSPEFLAKEKKICLDKSLALLAFQREDLNTGTLGLGEKKEKAKGRGFFDIDPFQPRDPGPEGLKPPWQIVVAKEKEEKEKEEEKDKQSIPLQQGADL